MKIAHPVLTMKTIRSPFYRNENERRSLLQKAMLEEDILLNSDQENQLKESATNEVGEVANRNYKVDVNTPWNVLLQHAMRYVGLVKVQDNQINVGNSQEALPIAMVGLEKCLSAIAREIEVENISGLRAMVMRQLSNNITARRSLVSTLRFLRCLDAEELIQGEQEIQSQKALLAQAKTVARKQSSDMMNKTLFGALNIDD